MTILSRIEREAGLPGLADALADRLRPTDLRSLLLSVAGRRAGKLRPAQVLQQYERDRFVDPCDLDPDRLDAVERVLLTGLPRSFERLELSPVCPVGTSSVLGGVSQDWVVTTTRGSEVVSDPTNVLALECASRRRRDRARPVHLCAVHRSLRAQRVEPPFSQHFQLLGLCSAARADEQDTLLGEHVGFYRRGLQALGAEEISIDESVRKPSYYTGPTFGISVGDVEAVEGGFVDWTQTLLGDRKERLLISGVGIELLARILASTER